MNCVLDSSAQQPQPAVIEPHAQQRKKGAPPFAPPQYAHGKGQQGQQHGERSHIGQHDGTRTHARIDPHEHLFAGAVSVCIGCEHLHDLFGRLAQSAGLTRTARSAGPVRSDPHADFSGPGPFDDAGVFLSLINI